MFFGVDPQTDEFTDILREPISTKYIRIQPRTWTGSIVMQFELHGCYVDRRITCSGEYETKISSELHVEERPYCRGVFIQKGFTDRLTAMGMFTQAPFVAFGTIFSVSHGLHCSILKIGLSKTDNSRQPCCYCCCVWSLPVQTSENSGSMEPERESGAEVRIIYRIPLLSVGNVHQIWSLSGLPLGYPAR